MSGPDAVLVEQHGAVRHIRLNRPEIRNAIDPATAVLLERAFLDFDADPESHVAVLSGAGDDFCAGADLKALATGQAYRIAPDGPGPLGATRLELGKPVVAAIRGHAVAGGLELALWADLRVADTTAVFGVYCRRWGVPLIDGGTWRLPRLIGLSRAMDLILTGRGVPADEAHAIGLAQRLVPDGEALPRALELAARLAALPQACLRADRRSAYENFGADAFEAFGREISNARNVLDEARTGAAKFAAGAGRHGADPA